jgi:hypothetical protein
MQSELREGFVMFEGCRRAARNMMREAGRAASAKEKPDDRAEAIIRFSGFTWPVAARG